MEGDMMGWRRDWEGRNEEEKGRWEEEKMGQRKVGREEGNVKGRWEYQMSWKVATSMEGGDRRVKKENGRNRK